MQIEPTHSVIFLYGPPGSGKSTIGQTLAKDLSIPFWDLEDEIENHAGMPMAEIFAIEGEEGYHSRERRMLELLIGKVNGVVALGGSSLLDPDNRQRVTSAGVVLCLIAPVEKLIERLQTQVSKRPQLDEENSVSTRQEILIRNLNELVQRRFDHYASFPQIDVSGMTPEEAVWAIQMCLGRFHVNKRAGGYDVMVGAGILDDIGRQLQLRGFKGHVALVSDDQVGELHSSRLVSSLDKAGFAVQPIFLPVGEQIKTLETLSYLWEAFLQTGLSQDSAVVALGGGVVGDLAGFAAATYLYGIPWIAAPTTLVGMADASLGGKTGINLPLGKDQVGAFHPPVLVLSDPLVLATLPEAELRTGMSVILKAGVIGDPILFEQCQIGWEANRSNLGEIVRRAMAVKLRVIQADPEGKGQWAVLNLGNTIGHAMEQASGNKLHYGEAISIGLAAEARLAEEMGLAEADLVAKIVLALQSFGLPTSNNAAIDRKLVVHALNQNKERIGGKIQFTLPIQIGQVKTGCEVDDIEDFILTGEW